MDRSRFLQVNDFWDFLFASLEDETLTEGDQLLKEIDNFLYRHFKRKGHTPANILIQPVEKNYL